MALDRSLYCYNVSNRIHKEGMQHHSGILSGQPVLFAGEIGVKNGELIKITTRSGHYRPREKELVNFLSVLSAQGVSLKSIVIKDDHGGQIAPDAEIYLKSHAQKKSQFKTNYRSIQANNPNLTAEQARQLFFEKYNEHTSMKKTIFNLSRTRLNSSSTLEDIFTAAKKGDDSRVITALTSLGWLNSNSQVTDSAPECLKSLDNRYGSSLSGSK